MTGSHRLILTYDVRKKLYQAYYRYMLGEFVPAMQELDLKMMFAWHVVGDGYAQRQVEFLAKTPDIMRSALLSPTFDEVENKLKTFTQDFSRKVVRFERPFQF